MKDTLVLFLFFFLTASLQAQSNSFDVFTYTPPEFFTKSEFPSRVLWSMKNNDTSFCCITIYKRQHAKNDIMRDVMAQWNEQVIKQLTKSSKKPLKIMTDEMRDGWASTLAIGNFYQHKKKCVVMLYSFRKDKTAACAVVAFSDKNFKGPVETFSKNLHLNN